MIVVPQLPFSAVRVAAGEDLPPLALVRELVAAGAHQVQLLDLDGSLVREPVQPQWLQSLVAVAGVPVRFDGRLHDARAAELLAKARFATIVIDHAALFDAALVRWTLDIYGARLCVEVQADGEYLFESPEHAFATEVIDVLSSLHLQGVRRVLYRDVTLDGAVPMARLRELCDRVPGVALTYAGRVQSLDEVQLLGELAPRVEAVLVDAALVLDGTLDLVAANRVSAR